MEEIYMVCLGVGILLPLIGLVLDGIFDVLHSFTISSFDCSIGHTDISFLPLSINALCLGSLLFGGIGLLFIDTVPVLPLNIICGAVGYISAVILQTILKKLRKVENFADVESSILGRDCKVITTILENDYGSVSLTIQGSSNITYTAKSEDDIEIKQNTEVEIVEIMKGYVVVRKKIDLVKKYS